MHKEEIFYGEASQIKLYQSPKCKITITFSENEDRDDLIEAFKNNGRPIAIVILKDKVDINDKIEEKVTKKEKGPYGDYAKKLYQSSFFMRPKVWECIGSDDEFLEWLRTNKCSYCSHKEPSEAAHVRRIANGAGTGIKPTYSAIPLCHECHSKQHQDGESAVGGKEWLDKQRIDNVKAWCWYTLKETLGYESFTEISPDVIRDWAEDNGISDYLPN